MNQEFWHGGLRFECARCSACCRHEPGFVFLSAGDIERLVARSGLAFRLFIDTFVRTVDVGTGNALSLKEQPNNDCVLWGQAGCRFYDARPVQCSTYPFWPGVLDSPEDWTREAADCPGIGRGRVIPAALIGESLWKRRANPPIIIAYDTALESIDEDTLLGSPRVASNPPDSRQAT